MTSSDVSVPSYFSMFDNNVLLEHFVFPNSENPLLKSKLSEQRLNESMYVVTAVSLEDIVTSLNHLLAINK